MASLRAQLWRAERAVQDAVMRRAAPAPKEEAFVYLGIDEPNYAYRFRPEELASAPGAGLLAADYPWSREVWALLLDKLMAAGARGVAFDLLLVSPGRGDEALAAALARHEGKVVLGSSLDVPAPGAAPLLTWPADSVTDALEDSVAASAAVTFFPDRDAVVRHSRRMIRLLTHDQPTLAAQLAALAREGKVDDASKVVTTDLEPRRFRFGGPSGTYAPIPLYQVFSPMLWRTNLKDGAVFRDKVVIVGPAAAWTQDLRRTAAAELMFGPEVHLHAAAAELNDAYIAEPGHDFTLGLIVATGFVVGLLFCLVEQPWWRTGLLLAVNAGAITLALTLYTRAGVMVALLPVLGALNTGGALCLVQKFFSTYLEKRRTRAMLERYVSHNFVSAVLGSAEKFEESLGGARRRCTMLFSDIRGFTTMTEAADSQALVAQLNEYLGEMVECVFRHEGTLDKFIGDAVMAVWGNVRVRTEREDAVSAVRAALDMLAALERLNAGWRARGVTELHIGVGLNHGEVIVGNLGAPRRKEFTVIGDAVNLASRLEGVTKEYGLALVLGESVAEHARAEFVVQAVDFIRVKGKTRPVAIFTVRPARDVSLEVYERALADYRAGRFAQARDGFADAARLAAMPGAAPAPGVGRDPLPTLYLKRCDAMLANPPGADWDGVFVMRSK